MSCATNKAKRKAFERMYHRGDMVDIHVKVWMVKTKAPLIKGALSVRFFIGRTTARDVKITDFELEATLDFSTVPYLVQIPWEAVFSIGDARVGGLIAHEDSSNTPITVVAPPSLPNKIGTFRVTKPSKVPAGWAVLTGGRVR